MACSIFPDPSENKVELSQNFNQITLITEGIYSLKNHASTHAIGGTDPLSPQDIGAQPSGNYIVEGDARLSDSRNPILHAHTHSASGIDPIDLSEYDIPSLPIKYNDLSNDPSELINVKRRTAKAWVNFNGVNIVSIRSSLNVSSITDNGVGDYTINFNNPFLNTNYCFVTWSRDWNTDNFVVNNLGARSTTSKTTNSVRLVNNYIANSLNYDSLELNAIFFST